MEVANYRQKRRQKYQQYHHEDDNDEKTSLVPALLTFTITSDCLSQEACISSFAGIEMENIGIRQLKEQEFGINLNFYSPL